MFRTLLAALCALLLAAQARAADVSVASSSWTDLGAGPLTIQNLGSGGAEIGVSDAATPTGTPTNFAYSVRRGETQTTLGTTHIWARWTGAATTLRISAASAGSATDMTATNAKLDVLHGDLSGAQIRVLPREDAAASGAVNGSITASGQAVVLPLAGYNGATIAYWGTFAGLNLSFGASYDGGTTYVAITARSVSGGAAATSTGVVSAAGAWTIYAPGATHVQASASAYASGAMSVRATPIAISADPAPSIGTVNTVGGTVATYANAASSTNGGLVSLARLASAASGTNSTVVKAAGGRFYKIVGYNAATSLRYLKIFNKASAPAVGTDTPYATVPLAPSAAFVIDFAPIGVTMTSGIGFGLTTGVADSDTGALTAGDIVGLSFFYQ